MERRHIKWLPLLLARLFFTYQYFSSEKFVNPETGRKSHVAMSTQEEASLGVQSYQQVDPRESIRFWQRMENAGGAQPPEFLSSHPSHGTRIQQLEAEMPKALEEYNKSSHADVPASL